MDLFDDDDKALQRKYMEEMAVLLAEGTPSPVDRKPSLPGPLQHGHRHARARGLALPGAGVQLP